MARIFLLDNKDSFIYNLADELEQIMSSVTVYRNNLPAEYITEQMDKAEESSLLVISPGPSSPQESGCMLELLKKTVGKHGILGICLGMQGIIEHFGGKINQANVAVRGKTSQIELSKHKLHEGLPESIQVARYHSLTAYDIKPPLKVIASHDQIPMSVIHEGLPIVGYQFHPESILTTSGKTILKQTIDYLLQWKN